MNGLSQWKLVTYLAAIFVAGGVSGWVVATRTAKQAARTPPRFDEFSKSYRDRLISKLTLTEAQKKDIDAILKRTSAEMESSFKQNLSRINTARSNRNAQVAAILSPEQRGQYEQLEKAWSQERRDRGTNSWKGRPAGRDHGERPSRGDGPPRGEGPRERRDRDRGTNNPPVTNRPPDGQQPQQP